MTSSEMFCPITDTKECIKHNCFAYVSNSKPSLCECNVCRQQFTTGGSCDEIGHNRIPRIIKEYPYCKHFKVDLWRNYNK